MHDPSRHQPTADTPSRADHAPGTERPGDRIGPYRLLRPLGEGGFGSVWEAERREPIVQRIAIKLVKAGMDTRAVIARFEQERQALAVMDHPNVAHVFDAGATPTGRPYFVMELVNGEPIGQYCDRHNLSIRQRLELFLPVCDAVQHAHHKGLIHRDIKPSNILVTVRDGSPIPKVIDFGVAKAVSRTLTDKTIVTEMGQLIGTPEYMSPEQAEMGATDVDTRTDVYSLGVVLYELLSGLLPFDSAALRAKGYADIQRTIREQDPLRPSARLTTIDGPTGNDIARHRLAGRADLARELRLELDWIPLKAMRKDRTERYNSPADLARDIQNYLAGRPLEAGPESAVYRLRKLVRRNKGPVLAAALLALALTLGFAGTALGFLKARDQAARATASAARFEAINRFMHSALQSSDPNQGGSQGALVSDVMLKSVRDLDAGAFKDQPELDADLRLTIAGILNGNGRPAEALSLAEKALATERSCRGESDEVVHALVQVALIRNGLGRAAEAEPLAREALGMARRLHGAGRGVPATLHALNALGLILQDGNNAADAEPMFREALAMAKALNAGDHPDVVRGLNNLAGSMLQQRRAGDAEPLLREALAMNLRLTPGDHPEVANSQNNLALVLRDQGKFADAEPLFRGALAMRRRLFSGPHPHVAQSLNNLAITLQQLGRGAEAEPLLRDAVGLYRSLYPGDHPEVARGLNNLGFVLLGLDQPAKAEVALREAVAMDKRVFPGDSPDTANAMKNLARCLDKLERSAEALTLAGEAAIMAGRALPDGHPVRTKCEDLLAELRSRLAVSP